MGGRLFRRSAGGRHEAHSAGSRPSQATQSVVLEALAKIGLDASNHAAARLDDERIQGRT
jgi:protein-tyrosine-phosphatase